MAVYKDVGIGKSQIIECYPGARNNRASLYPSVWEDKKKWWLLEPGRKEFYGKGFLERSSELWSKIMSSLRQPFRRGLEEYFDLTWTPFSGLLVEHTWLEENKYSYV